MKSLNLRYRISPDVIFQEVHLGESLLLNVKTLAYFSFDELGTRIWGAMQETDDADLLLRHLEPECGLPLESLTMKVTAILHGLEGSGLIAFEPVPC